MWFDAAKTGRISNSTYSSQLDTVQCGDFSIRVTGLSWYFFFVQIRTDGRTHEHQLKHLDFWDFAHYLVKFSLKTKTKFIKQKFRVLFISLQCNSSHLVKLSRLKWIASNCGWPTSKQNWLKELIRGKLVKQRVAISLSLGIANGDQSFSKLVPPPCLLLFYYFFSSLYKFHISDLPWKHKLVYLSCWTEAVTIKTSPSYCAIPT